jgi:hypothetical protein
MFFGIGTQHQHLQLLQCKCLKNAHPLKTPSPMFFKSECKCPHLQLLQHKCLKKEYPLKTPSPMFFGIRMQMPTSATAAMQMPEKGTSPQDSFTYVLQESKCKTHMQLLQRKCLKKAHPLKTPSPMFFGIGMQMPTSA